MARMVAEPPGRTAGWRNTPLLRPRYPDDDDGVWSWSWSWSGDTAQGQEASEMVVRPFSLDWSHPTAPDLLMSSCPVRLNVNMSEPCGAAVR